MRRLARWQERHYEGDDFTGRGAFQEYPDRWQGNGTGNQYGAGGMDHATGAGIREEAMRNEMLARNTAGREGQYVDTSGRPSVADSQSPMMRQV